MIYADVLQNINKHISLNATEKNIFLNSYENVFVSKKTILLHQGNVCNFETYIRKGCLRIYYINSSGVECTLLFGVEDWWVCDIESFTNKTPSSFYIEAMDDCELLMIKSSKKDLLLSKVPKLEKYFKIIVERHLSITQKRVVNILTKPARIRYKEFLEVYPELNDKISQQHIASYLGITPVFLSKIKNEIR
nr:Crp/Fnr family transcriptional regulator [uncultured Chryseobacterium sp.]